MLRDKIGPGNGRVLTFGFWPGITYWMSNDFAKDAGYRGSLESYGGQLGSPQHLPEGWDANAASAIVLPCKLAGIERRIELPFTGVEALMLEARGAVLVTLLPWANRTADEIRVTVRTDMLTTSTSPLLMRLNVSSVRFGALTWARSAANEVEIILPSLETVDAIVLSFIG